MCTCGSAPPSSIDIIDIGLSDHRLLRWSSRLPRPPLVYTSSTRRVWRSFEVDLFRTNLSASALCDDRCSSAVGDALVSLYKTTIIDLLDRQALLKRITCRQRPSSVWFDEECRVAKRLVRSMERDIRHAGESSTADPLVVAVWRAERHRYAELQSSKRYAFWTSRVDVDQSQPKRLWRSFNELLGRDRPPASVILANRPPPIFRRQGRRRPRRYHRSTDLHSVADRL